MSGEEKKDRQDRIIELLEEILKWIKVTFYLNIDVYGGLLPVSSRGFSRLDHAQEKARRVHEVASRL